MAINTLVDLIKSAGESQVLLDNGDCVLRGKAGSVKETEKRLKHKLLPRNA